MEGDKRRESIVELLKNSEKPISGTEAAKKFGVSRQIIVQDIALLRATNKNILSTNKEYHLPLTPAAPRCRYPSPAGPLLTEGPVPEAPPASAYACPYKPRTSYGEKLVP